MKKLLIAISLATLAPTVTHGDIFEFTEHAGGSSSTGKSEWFLLDDDRDTTTDPYPWGITAICDGKGGHEFSIALHGILSPRPKSVELVYAIGHGEPVATRGFALDSILTGLSGTLATDVAAAVASGQRILLSVTGDSVVWSSSFEGYATDPDKVAFVSGGCR